MPFLEYFKETMLAEKTAVPVAPDVISLLKGSLKLAFKDFSFFFT
jgi:hypothetical protein